MREPFFQKNRDSTIRQIFLVPKIFFRNTKRNHKWNFFRRKTFWHLFYYLFFCFYKITHFFAFEKWREPETFRNTKYFQRYKKGLNNFRYCEKKFDFFGGTLCWLTKAFEPERWTVSTLIWSEFFLIFLIKNVSWKKVNSGQTLAQYFPFPENAELIQISCCRFITLLHVTYMRCHLRWVAPT